MKTLTDEQKRKMLEGRRKVKKKKRDKSMPSMRECIGAQCHHCLGYYSDNASRDCQNVTCPLYCHQPYRELEPDYTWERYSHKRKGLILKSKYEKGTN